jgi:hypothetical protein
MKTYTCTCGQRIFFENVTCMACGRELGFLPDVLRLSSLEPAQNGLFKADTGNSASPLYKKCQNYAKESVCNWMIGTSPEEKTGAFCASCQLNQTIPDMNRQQNHALWARMETAKRRLIYSLLNLKLPIANKAEDPEQGLAFAFLDDVVKPDGTVSKVLTGHENDLITLNIVEADDAARETIRVAMGEPHRTLLGHFRHEIGHYYWDRLVRGTKLIERYRDLFGNEQGDYMQALRQYYSKGASANWQNSYISAYATAHPWEDWAECWAHFMHIQDTLETANQYGLVGKSIRLDPRSVDGKSTASSEQIAVEEIISAWAYFTIALNSINRSMGLHDTYPFVISPAIVNKLSFIFEVIASASAKSVVLV